MKNAFEEARTLAKDEKLVAELEKAIAENDVAKVKSLLGETEDIRLVTQGTEEEILQAAKRIKAHRVANNLREGNYGYIEGQINGKVVDNRLWRSVPLDVAENEIHIFNAIKVEGNKGKEWLRITDSEYRMLKKLAKDLGAKKGDKYLEIIGEIKIVSELPYCLSCQGVIQDFSKMFPSVKIKLVDNVKY